MYFQWEHRNTAVTRPMHRLWRLKRRAWETALCTKLQNAVTPNFAPKQKWESIHF